MSLLSKRFFFIALYVFLLAGLLTSAEIVARLKHYTPFQWRQEDLKEPTMNKPDPTLGWIPKAGKYLMPAYVPGGAKIQYTFLEDGSRATSDNLTAANYGLIILGCSFTQGYAISDLETFAWKLQTEFPFLKVGNFGVCAYGTYQSLLFLRKLFAQGAQPLVVVYGFCIFHEERNIAPVSWVKFLVQFSKRGFVAVPYCSLRGGQIVEHPAIQWPQFPLQQYFALPQLLIATYYQSVTDETGRKRDQREITEKLLIEMHDLTKKHDARLIVVMLTGSNEERKFYADFLQNHGIEVVDANCNLSDDFRVQGEGHPNSKAHSLWANAIAEYLKLHMPGAIGRDYISKDRFIINEGSGRHFGELLKNRTFEQSFIAEAGLLEEIDLFLANFARKNSGSIFLEIIDPSNQTIAKIEKSMESIKDNSWEKFEIGPLYTVMGQTYKIRLTSSSEQDGNAITWWASLNPTNSYVKGNAIIDGVPQDTDFAFRIKFSN